jgi:hypothetical protein
MNQDRSAEQKHGSNYDKVAIKTIIRHQKFLWFEDGSLYYGNKEPPFKNANDEA